jgi:hypothetical protein
MPGSHSAQPFLEVASAFFARHMSLKQNPCYAPMVNLEPGLPSRFHAISPTPF